MIWYDWHYWIHRTLAVPWIILNIQICFLNKMQSQYIQNIHNCVWSRTKSTKSERKWGSIVLAKGGLQCCFKFWRYQTQDLLYMNAKVPLRQSWAWIQPSNPQTSGQRFIPKLASSKLIDLAFGAKDCSWTHEFLTPQVFGKLLKTTAYRMPPCSKFLKVNGIRERNRNWNGTVWHFSWMSWTIMSW